MFPTVNADGLTKAFGAMRSQQVAVSNEQFVNLTDSTATITCTWSVAFVG